jgi:hypothetical protein
MITNSARVFSLADVNLALVVGGCGHHRRRHHHHRHHHHASAVHHSSPAPVAPVHVAPAPVAPSPAGHTETELGNMCRDGWKSVGGALGGVLESFGWGALPGTMLGGLVGRQICPE